MLPIRDAELVQIVDQALADATARGIGKLACRPGCTPCCHGVFRISALDGLRLRSGLQALELSSPERAASIQARAEAAVALLAPKFPGDATSGLLPMETEEDDAAWDHFADLPEVDTPCPVLDPASGGCELYSSRPLTCRIFGPPVRSDGGLGVCELCYVDASDAELLAGEMHLTHHALEAELDQEVTAAPACSGQAGETVIAWALLAGRR